jgi:ligand-binding sensor domain-containing protein/signal transduction histidine kinase
MHLGRHYHGRISMYFGWLLVRLCCFIFASLGGISKQGMAATLVQHEDYAVDVWQTADGLPQNSVSSIAQTPDGYLWLATFNGLARFDGVRFTVFDDHNTPALATSRIVRLDLDGEGGLWIITQSGELTRLLHDQFTSYGAARGLPANGASAVGISPSGQVWLRDRAGGLHRLQGERFAPVIDSAHFGAGPLGSFGFDEEGNLWFRQGRTLAKYDHGGYVTLKNPDGNGDASVRSFGPRAQGGLVLITTLGLRKYRGSMWEPEIVACPAEMKNLTSVFEDRHSQVWVGTYGNGLFRYDKANGWRRFVVGNGLLHNAVRAVFEDREGNLWAGTDGGGLHRFKPRVFRSFEVKDGLSGNVVMSVSEGPGDVFWLALNGGGVNRIQGGRITVLAPSPQLEPLNYVYSILADRSGTVWIGSYDRGLIRYRDGRFGYAPLGQCPTNGPVLALLEDHAGTLWAGGAGGLWFIRSDLCQSISFQEGISHADVRVLAEDGSGVLYVGTDGGGVYRLQGDRFARITEREGLADNHVSSIYIDAEGTAWIGGVNAGLSRLREGQIHRYSKRIGLPSDRITAIQEDDYGRLWFGSERGIFWASRADLNEVAAGRRGASNFHLYGESDGLTGLECSSSGQPSCCKASDGKLWFATVKGVAVVDPKNLPRNPLPPSVVLEEVVLDENTTVSNFRETLSKRYSAAGNSRSDASGSIFTSGTGGNGTGVEEAPASLTVPAYVNRVDFHYTGLSLVAPEKVCFRYQLEGFDKDWIEAGTRRTAHYTRIQPGHYRFRVNACNNDGIWNKAAVALAVNVLPAWWQTWWCRAVATLGVTGLLSWLIATKLRRLHGERAVQVAFAQRLIRSQEDERKRIAAELHDSLGQDLLIIKNRALLGLRDKATTGQASEQFGEISQLATQSLEEVREISHNLRPYQLDRLGLTRALQAMAAGVSRASGILIRTELDPLDGLFGASTDIHFYRIVQELLNNIVKHSDAAAARLSVRHRGKRLFLEVEDDGCGFDTATHSPQSATSHGLGLTDIAERVRLLGGSVRCNSHPAAGTRWAIEIPVTQTSPK